VWKIVCFFLTMLMVVPHIQEDSEDPVGNLFNMFGQSFSQPEITVTEVRTMFTDIRKKILCLKVQQQPEGKRKAEGKRLQT
jgi:hypothetical protein